MDTPNGDTDGIATPPSKESCRSQETFSIVEATYEIVVLQEISDIKAHFLLGILDVIQY